MACIWCHASGLTTLSQTTLHRQHTQHAQRAQREPHNVDCAGGRVLPFHPASQRAALFGQWHGHLADGQSPLLLTPCGQLHTPVSAGQKRTEQKRQYGKVIFAHNFPNQSTVNEGPAWGKGA